MKGLKVTKEKTFPVETATQKLAWLGTTGSGKTYGASKMAEQMWYEGAQFVVLDPVGVWYGLRLAADGKSPSKLDIPILGGLHGDVPLQPTVGKLIADLIVDKNLSVVLDVSQFESDADKARFAGDFAGQFYFRKKAKPSAVHLFLEEVQEFVPQNPQRGEEKMLHNFVRMQKLGRNFGIGSSYISQRPQEVNKKALNMAQTLFVFRNTGTHERKAIELWIKDNSLDENIANDLPKIPTGECHIWSPEFLKISEMVHILQKDTFNASATPEVGKTTKAATLSAVDVAALKQDMADVIKESERDDPKALRARIIQLEKTPLSTTAPLPVAMGVSQWMNYGTKYGYDKFFEDKILKTRDKEWEDKLRMANSEIGRVSNILHQIFKLTEKEQTSSIISGPAKTIVVKPEMFKDMKYEVKVDVDEFYSKSPASFAESAPMGTGERQVLIAIAQHPDGMTREHITVQTGYKRSTRDAYIQRLIQKGYVESNRDGYEQSKIFPTTEGIQTLGNDYQPLPTGQDLVDYHLRKLPEGEAQILRILIEKKQASREEISGWSGYKRSTRDAYIQRLATRQLVIVEGQNIRVSEHL